MIFHCEDKDTTDTGIEENYETGEELRDRSNLKRPDYLNNYVTTKFLCWSAQSRSMNPKTVV